MELKILKLEPERRDPILNAALKEFAAKGFRRASTNIIAKEAGISKGLMFHYVNSKQDLFLFLYDYCTKLIDEEYLDVMNFYQSDILEKLRHSYLLQLDLIQKYPWIFEFIQISSEVESDEVNRELEKRVSEKLSWCQETMFESIDISKFKEGLDVEKCKQLILWSNIGFTNQIIEGIRDTNAATLDYDQIIAELNGYLNELRKVFYK
ncbi:TetR/AcrR family transcriptional regulator [Gracilibacillus phocaeensis]|uniref:TetR/AcrR family transcriptional regulator n=1 Tax=Gracilibacillus phocaeensis TaxID=2042304 RepID=UPI0010325635|nr:TetR/AcrR family transcriptional regulator [Gracilibacillus phocaeensis]